MKLAIQLLVLLALVSFSVSVHVIVVGAGVSGLSAANNLTANGHTVTILEGRNRLCGRVWTDRASFGPDVVGAEADLGAGWIHGSHPTKNVITKLFIDAKLDQFAQTKDESLEVYGVDGNRVKGSAQTAAYAEYLNGMNKIRDIAANKKSSISSQESVGPIFRDNLTNWNNDVYRFTVASSIEFDTSADIDSLSLLRSEDDSKIKGVEMLLVKGYDQLCDKILNKNSFNVKFNVNVTQVIDNDEKGVIVIDSNGNTYQGQKVIVTVPLGSLKANQIKFTPALSANKTAAIQRLGYGNVNKLVLEFPDIFWPDVQYIGKTVADPEKRGLWTYFLNAANLTKKPTLVAIAIGKNSYDSEKLSKEENVKVAVDNLKTIFKDKVKDPVKAVQSRWGQDYFAGFGTYSFGRIGSLEDDHDTVAESVGNIYFAGEHCFQRFRGTVHGAYLNGHDVAFKLNNDLKKPKVAQPDN